MELTKIGPGTNRVDGIALKNKLQDFIVLNKNPTIMYAERLLKSKYMFWRRENRVEKENSLKLTS